MWRFFIGFFTNKNYLTILGAGLLCCFIFIQSFQIASLEQENQAITLQSEQYKLLCKDLEQKLNAQKELVKNALSREQKALEKAQERKNIMQNTASRKQDNAKEIIDNETRKKVMQRLNLPL